MYDCIIGGKECEQMCITSVALCQSERTRQTSEPLVPIPVGRHFHRIGVDVLQLSLMHTNSGNHYIVSFVDYFTKWAFPMPDQKADRIARIFVNKLFAAMAYLNSHYQIVLLISYQDLSWSV